MSDTLHLATDAFAHVVRLTPTEEGSGYVPNGIYGVATVGDSLYYRNLGTESPRSHHPSTISVRALRPLDVPGAKAHYVWVETEERGVYHPNDTTQVTRVLWTGYIFTYDAGRGMRYLYKAPIRLEKTKNGEFVGSEQWDVAVPEPGIMEVSCRSHDRSVAPLAPVVLQQHHYGWLDGWLAGIGDARSDTPDLYELLIDPAETDGGYTSRTGPAP